MSERKGLDPHLQELLSEQAEHAPDLTRLSDAERVKVARAGMPRGLAARDAIEGLPNAVARRDLTLADGLPARLYTPVGGEAPRPLLVYLHGGGWVAGSLDTHDPFCCLLSEAARVLILSIGYRQPPEHPFPAALDDAIAAVRWAAAHAGELGGDPERLALGGDSAGGQLAAVAANELCAAPDAPHLRALLLLYPVTDHPDAQPDAHHGSYEQNATGFGLTAEAMQWLWRQYAPEGSPDDPRLSPLRLKKVPELPATLVATAEYDVLRDEGIAYADKLRAAGVALTHLHAADMNHNFAVAPDKVARFPQSLETLNEIAGWLRAMLGVSLRAARD